MLYCGLIDLEKNMLSVRQNCDLAYLTVFLFKIFLAVTFSIVAFVIDVKAVPNLCPWVYQII